MENTGKSAKAPGIAIAAFVLGIGSILLPLVTGLLIYLFNAVGVAAESGILKEALGRVFMLLIEGMPLLAIAAVICGAIGLHQSRRLPRTSKKGVAFSVIGLVAGVLMVIIIAVILLVFFLTAKI